MNTDIKKVLSSLAANGAIVILYFLLWMLFHYLWMRYGTKQPDVVFFTLPVVLFFCQRENHPG